MSENIAEKLKRRAFYELGRRDFLGTALGLNYRQKQALKGDDVHAIRTLLDRQLKPSKRPPRKSV